MSTKPTAVVRLAETTNYPHDATPEQDTATKADPARTAYGYRPGEKPKATEFNFLMNLVGQWHKYTRLRVGRVHTFEFSHDADLAQGESGTGVVTYDESSGPDRTVGWSLFTTANADVAALASQYVFIAPISTKSIHVLEWELDATALVGTPQISLRQGIVNENVLASTNDAVAFVKTTASANWFVATCNGTTVTSVDTGVAATGIQRFAIVWYGATNSPSAAERAEFYIDDVLVHATATTLPLNAPTDAASRMLVGVMQQSTGHTDDRTCKVSPIKYSCCRYI